MLIMPRVASSRNVILFGDERGVVGERGQVAADLLQRVSCSSTGLRGLA
ncbi:MAG: hypothetical protein MZV70_28650 [Desulfobacterales bacterium]|nr:hypothetical protein [Desulfobacterales bacterium]